MSYYALPVPPPRSWAEVPNPPFTYGVLPLPPPRTWGEAGFTPYAILPIPPPLPEIHPIFTWNPHGALPIPPPSPELQRKGSQVASLMQVVAVLEGAAALLDPDDRKSVNKTTKALRDLLDHRKGEYLEALDAHRDG